jgi:hypothetical protein
LQRQPSDVDLPEPIDRARVPVPTAIAVALHRLELTYRFARNHPVRVGATVFAIAFVGFVAWRLLAAPAVGAPEAQLPLATRSVTSAGAVAGSTSRGSEVVVTRPSSSASIASRTKTR